MKTAACDFCLGRLCGTNARLHSRAEMLQAVQFAAASGFYLFVFLINDSRHMVLRNLFLRLTCFVFFICVLLLICNSAVVLYAHSRQLVIVILCLCYVLLMELQRCNSPASVCHSHTTLTAIRQ